LLRTPQQGEFEMPTIKLNEATPAELRTVAVHLGLDVSQHHTGAKTLATIRTAYEQDEYVLPDEGETSVQALHKGNRHPVKEPRIKPGFSEIRLAVLEGQLPYGRVSINGRVFKMMRDVPVVVPNSVTQALDNAVQDRPVRDENGRLVGWQKVKREPYQLIERG
jgi:hypothetical protein